MSIQSKYNYLETAYPELLTGIGAIIQKGKLHKRFETIRFSDDDIKQLEKSKELCELKIIELWDSQDSQEFKALCASYFDIAGLLPSHSKSEYYIYEQIKCIAFGYLGEHWHFVKQYLKANITTIENLEVDEDWNKRLLTLCFKALTSLVIKENWRDIDQAVERINQLREEQNEFEYRFLNRLNEENRPYSAAELVALYHFAKSVDILGNFLLSGTPPEPEEQIRYHLNLSREFAGKAANISLGLLFQFFEALAIKMVRNTICSRCGGPGPLNQLDDETKTCPHLGEVTP